MIIPGKSMAVLDHSVWLNAGWQLQGKAMSPTESQCNWVTTTFPHFDNVHINRGEDIHINVHM